MLELRQVYWSHWEAHYHTPTPLQMILFTGALVNGMKHFIFIEDVGNTF
jgi:hypothetical protein